MGYMPYTTNPHLPRVRMQAVCMVRQGSSIRQAARHFGFSHTTVMRWVKRAPDDGRRAIPTKSSRPHSHPHTLGTATVKAILDHRHQYGRCAEVIHHQLAKDDICVSLSSVKRTLKRNGLTYPSKWKKWHQYPPRPTPETPGILVQIDTMWDGYDSRLYAYAVLDLCTRWVYAEPSKAANGQQSAAFISHAQTYFPFPLRMVQSDHGSEFAKYFTKQLIAQGIVHRHSRVRRPTDNGHIERFIRTLQQECLSRTARSYQAWEKAIPDFIRYYNTERPHMGLAMKTPLEVVQSY